MKQPNKQYLKYRLIYDGVVIGDSIAYSENGAPADLFTEGAAAFHQWWTKQAAVGDSKWGQIILDEEEELGRMGPYFFGPSTMEDLVDQAAVIMHRIAEKCGLPPGAADRDMAVIRRRVERENQK